MKKYVKIRKKKNRLKFKAFYKNQKIKINKVNNKKCGNANELI